MLNLPEGRHARAFRAFVDYLMDGPRLKSGDLGLRWVLPRGDGVADKLPTTAAELPCVRLIPELGPVVPKTIGPHLVQESPVDVTIETAVAGTDWADSANLWGAIQARGCPTDRAQRQAMYAALKDANAGIMEVRLIQPAAAVNDTGGPFAVATGKIRLVVWI